MIIWIGDVFFNKRDRLFNFFFSSPLAPPLPSSSLSVPTSHPSFLPLPPSLSVVPFLCGFSVSAKDVRKKKHVWLYIPWLCGYILWLCCFTHGYVVLPMVMWFYPWLCGFTHGYVVLPLWLCGFTRGYVQTTVVILLFFSAWLCFLVITVY